MRQLNRLDERKKKLNKLGDFPGSWYACDSFEGWPSLHVQSGVEASLIHALGRDCRIAVLDSCLFAALTPHDPAAMLWILTES